MAKNDLQGTLDLLVLKTLAQIKELQGYGIVLHIQLRLTIGLCHAPLGADPPTLLHSMRLRDRVRPGFSRPRKTSDCFTIGVVATSNRNPPLRIFASSDVFRRLFLDVMIKLRREPIVSKAAIQQHPCPHIPSLHPRHMPSRSRTSLVTPSAAPASGRPAKPA